MPRTRSTLQLPLRCFTVQDYHRMIEACILREGEKVELIEEAIVEMASLSGRYIGCVIETGEHPTLHLGRRARVSIRNSVRFGPRTQPEPNIAILRRPAGGYRSDVPMAEDVLLPIEVAGSSLAHDSGPAGRAPTDTSEHRRGDSLTSIAIPDRTIPVNVILGEAAG